MCHVSLFLEWSFKNVSAVLIGGDDRKLTPKARESKQKHMHQVGTIISHLKKIKIISNISL